MNNKNIWLIVCLILCSNSLSATNKAKSTVKLTTNSSNTLDVNDCDLFGEDAQIILPDDECDQPGIVEASNDQQYMLKVVHHRPNHHISQQPYPMMIPQPIVVNSCGCGCDSDIHDQTEDDEPIFQSSNNNPQEII